MAMLASFLQFFLFSAQTSDYNFMVIRDAWYRVVSMQTSAYKHFSQGIGNCIC